MNSNSKVRLGRAGEELAAELLSARGYAIMERNYRCSAGEIDIVAANGADIVFAEVKTRAGNTYGRPCEAVDAAKQRRIREAAIYYLREKSGGRTLYSRLRFDVIEIAVDHIADAF